MAGSRWPKGFLPPSRNLIKIPIRGPFVAASLPPGRSVDLIHSKTASKTSSISPESENDLTLIREPHRGAVRIEIERRENQAGPAMFDLSLHGEGTNRIQEFLGDFEVGMAFQVHVTSLSLLPLLSWQAQRRFQTVVDVFGWSPPTDCRSCGRWNVDRW